VRGAVSHHLQTTVRKLTLPHVVAVSPLRPSTNLAEASRLRQEGNAARPAIQSGIPSKFLEACLAEIPPSTSSANGPMALNQRCQWQHPLFRFQLEIR